MQESIKETSENQKIDLTGNPFVDTGLAVIAAYAKLEAIEELTINTTKNVYNNTIKPVDYNSKLKSFTQIFGTNNPLFQSAYGFKKGIGPSEQNKKIYEDILNSLLDEINKSNNNGLLCWACGKPTMLEFSEICHSAIEKNKTNDGKTEEEKNKKKVEKKEIGRDWFPLSGSLGSDAQALPSASESPTLCAKCLFVIHYLPLGVILINGKIAVFQSNSTDFWYELIKDLTHEVKSRINTELYETLGKKEGNKEVMRRIIALFERLKNEQKFSQSDELVLYYWSFSNSGTDPSCHLEKIPNSVLSFLLEAVRNGLKLEIEGLINAETKKEYSLFTCISEKRDYQRLYPKRTWKGASAKLFLLYQMYILNRSAESLLAAYNLAKEIASDTDKKELERMRRSEGFAEMKWRNKAKSIMLSLVEDGKFNFGCYRDIFFKTEESDKIFWEGWNVIKFYLHNTRDEDKPKIETETKKDNNVILFYAASIYKNFIDNRGKDRFQKEVIEGAKRGRINATWLKNQFCQLAELKSEFTYDAWLRLNKGLYIEELIFQMRLLWAEWISNDRGLMDIELEAIEGAISSGLPEKVDNRIEELFNLITINRGIDYFYKFVLMGLRNRKIDLFWFKIKLMNLAPISPLTEQEWEYFLLDNNGDSIKANRLFQLHLHLANLYRKKLQGKK